MKNIIAVACAAMLAGCVSQVTLISQDSQRYEMKVDQLARRLSATVDGIFYTGTAVPNTAVAFGTAQTYGLKPVYASGTTIMAGNDGRALLTASTGEYLECGYTKSGTRLVGNCVSNTGRKFVLTTM